MLGLTSAWCDTWQIDNAPFCYEYRPLYEHTSVSIAQTIIAGTSWRTRTKKTRTNTRNWEQNSVHSTELRLWLTLGRSSARLCTHGTWHRCCPYESVRGPPHRREVHKRYGTRVCDSVLNSSSNLSSEQARVAYPVDRCTLWRKLTVGLLDAAFVKGFRCLVV